MKLAKKLSFMLAYLLTTLPFVGLYYGGLCNFVTIFILFSAIPLVDYWVSDKTNPDSTEENKLSHSLYFKGLTWFYVPLQLLYFLVAIYYLSHYTYSWYEWLGFTLSIGLLTGGLGITIAHELMHKNSRFDRFLSKILLSMVCYGHFFIEHVRGHHVRVATPEDPATARLGENIYHFLPRTIIGSFRSAFWLEIKRLQQKGYFVYGWHNQFWWIIPLPISIALLCYYYGGWIILCFFFLQSLTAIIMLEVVNYVEHYGLLRNKLNNGDYEKVNIHHSWNANHWLSNVLLFHLQRHSDHHAFGARPYQILRHRDESPQLPSGYLGMIVLALFPPLWRQIMDKRVLAYRQKLNTCR